MKKKISTAEYAETAEDFLPKDSRHESSHEYFNLSKSSRISAVWVGTHPDEDERMNAEEAEGAEFLPWTALWSLRVLESVGNGAVPSPCPRALSLLQFLPLRSLYYSVAKS